MSVKNDERGFIFTLDATLAVLVSLIAIVGVAQIGSPYTVYSQHSQLQIERYGNDASQVIQLSGGMGRVMELVENKEFEEAKALAREELRKVLPSELQFKLVVGDNLLAVYPNDNSGWENRFSNVNDLYVSAPIYVTPPLKELRLLAWLDDSKDQELLNSILSGMEWEVTYTDNEARFQEEIQRDNLGYYHTVFIPDADLTFVQETIDNLVQFSSYGRLVVGGDTLWNNLEADDSLPDELAGVFGIDDEYILRYAHADEGMMYIWDSTHPITEVFIRGHPVDYPDEENLYEYSLQGGTALSHWYHQQTDSYLGEPAIIFNDEDEFNPGTGVLFNMRLAQAASSDEISSQDRSDWITLAKRSVYWISPFWIFRRVTLYVWRGEGV